jgi:hypothetical protein
MTRAHHAALSRSALSRRSLGKGVLAGAGLLLVGACSDVMRTTPGPAAAPGYGPLVPDPAKRLALPQGFAYRVVTEAGVTRLDSGEPTPAKHDGTGAFTGPDGGTLLVNNHEIDDPFAGYQLPVPHLDGLVYDPGAAGGCTVVRTDRDGGRLGETVGVAGTVMNCAGGVTPWQTWLTCEETEKLAGEAGCTKDHGYVFEVDPRDPANNRDPQPIRALGRFAHEAVVVDPGSGELYLTEDAAEPNGLLYRWQPPTGTRPDRPGALRALAPDAGTLAAMTCTDGAGAHVDDLSRAVDVGTRYTVSWTPVPDRDARTQSVRKQLNGPDITRARKLEGMWWGSSANGTPGAYVVSSFARTESPVQHDGQVWFYDPAQRSLTLKLRFGVNPDAKADGALDGPDNITVSPYGGVLVAEDGEGVQHLFGATEAGATFPIARNEIDDNEFTGPVYSPDRRILYANLQTPGIMFAITGPWRSA